MNALTKKEFGLPVWAWGIIIAVVVFLLYRHYKNAASSSNSSTVGTSTTPDTTGAADDTSGGGGGPQWQGGSNPQDQSGELGTLASNLTANTSALQALLAQGTPTSSSGTSGTNPSATTPVAGTKGLSWGNQTYTSRSSFDAYLSSKGVSVTQFATRHPAAYAEYLALPAGKPATKAVKKTTSKASTTAKASVHKASVKAKSVVSKAGTASAKPVKAAAPHTTKAPAKASSLIKSVAQSGRTITQLQKSALIGSKETSTVRAVPQTSHAIKAPVKSAVKPAPVARPIQAKKANPRPPVKAKK